MFTQRAIIVNKRRRTETILNFPLAPLSRRDLDRPEGNLPVIALDHERAGRRFLVAQSAWRDSLLHLHVFVNHLVVEDDLEELRVLDLLAFPEARGPEVNDELLPLAILL